jgi:hypothetical protein
VLKKRKVEAHDDFILGPVSPKEYKETVAELNGSRTNRVFEFFKVNAPERIGFAKHREAAERKAAALTAAEADAGETATSPRAAPKRAGKRNAPAAATATAEGRARKKRGGRPADSPPSPKRTRIVDVTEPPKIIPYYRLSRSTWPLSNNKELLSRFRRVKPGKSHTTGSLICAKPTRRRDQGTTLHYIKGSQVQHYYKPGFSYIKVNMIRV